MQRHARCSGRRQARGGALVRSRILAAATACCVVTAALVGCASDRTHAKSPATIVGHRWSVTTIIVAGETMSLSAAARPWLSFDRAGNLLAYDTVQHYRLRAISARRADSPRAASEVVLVGP